MASNITRMPRGQVADPSQQWFWNGSNWQCGCDPDNGGGFPPFGPPVFSGPTNQPPWYPGANGGVSFGTVAPPNPVRGHFWWDGVVLWMFDGAAWVATGGAAGTTPPSTTPPANPSNGQQWFNGTTLFVWDGNAWVPVSQTKSTISATAPPNPNPGDLWFDGQQQRIWTGSAWALVGPGATVGPVGTTTITFAMPQPIDITGIGTTAVNFTILNWTGTPQINTQAGSFDPVTQKLTPKQPGIYEFSARFPCWQGGGIAILKNDPGSYSWQNTSVPVVATTSESTGGFIQTIGLTAMNGTTDFVRVWAWGTDGTFHNGGGNPMFSAAVFP